MQYSDNRRQALLGIFVGTVRHPALPPLVNLPYLASLLRPLSSDQLPRHNGVKTSIFSSPFSFSIMPKTDDSIAIGVAAAADVRLIIERGRGNAGKDFDDGISLFQRRSS